MEDKRWDSVEDKEIDPFKKWDSIVRTPPRISKYRSRGDENPRHNSDADINNIEDDVFSTQRSTKKKAKGSSQILRQSSKKEPNRVFQKIISKAGEPVKYEKANKKFILR